MLIIVFFLCMYCSLLRDYRLEHVVDLDTDDHDGTESTDRKNDDTAEPSLSSAALLSHSSSSFPQALKEFVSSVVDGDRVQHVCDMLTDLVVADEMNFLLWKKRVLFRVC